MDLHPAHILGCIIADMKIHMDAIAGLARQEVLDVAEAEKRIDRIQGFAKGIKLLQAHMRALAENRERAITMLTDLLELDTDCVSMSSSGLRTISVHVSQEMIDQSVLALTDARTRGMVKDGERFSIELPDGSRFETELCQQGNELRERGMIRKFYESERILDGASVILRETQQGIWTLGRGHWADLSEEL